jgi:hypothetical protein
MRVYGCGDNFESCRVLSFLCESLVMFGKRVDINKIVKKEFVNW